MKIFICGNCQLDALTDAVIAALDIQGIKSEVSGRRYNDKAFADADKSGALCRFLNGFDLVVTNTYQLKAYLDRHNSTYCFLPDLFFHGFHPDICYLRFSRASTPLFFHKSTAMSLIVFFGWQNDWSIERTASSFTDGVFDSLGYFDAFTDSIDALDERFRALNFLSEQTIFELSKPERGMHEIGHPTLRVSFSLLKEIFFKLNIELQITYSDVSDAGVTDALSNEVIWPVYPEIAQRLGFRGSYLTNKAGLVLPNLKEFISWQYNALDEALLEAGGAKDLIVQHISGIPPYRQFKDVAEIFL